MALRGGREISSYVGAKLPSVPFPNSFVMLSLLMASRFREFSPTNQLCQWHWPWKLSLQGPLCLESSPAPLEMPVRLHFKAFCAWKRSAYQEYLGNISGWKNLHHLLGDLSQSQPATATPLSSATLLLMSVSTEHPNEPSPPLGPSTPCVCSMCWRCLCSGAGPSVQS